MDARCRELLEEQASLVARWQLVDAGLSPAAIRHFAAEARVIADGVFATGHGPLTGLQRRWAAVLGAPRSFLGLASAGDEWRFRPWRMAHEIVVRPGSGGPRMLDGVLVFRSTTLAGNTTTLHGLPITTPERTIVDLGAHVRGRPAERMIREAVRLRLTTMPRLQRRFHQSRGRRGVAELRNYVERFGALPFARCKSDAEAMGLQVLAESGRPIPGVNVVIAGEEADFSWPKRQMIIEIDGPQFHLFAEEDARKDAVWRSAGWRVRRIPSGRVYDAPHELVALYDAR